MFSFHYYDIFYPHVIASFLYYLSTFDHYRLEKKSREGLLILPKRFERIKKDSVIITLITDSLCYLFISQVLLPLHYDDPSHWKLSILSPSIHQYDPL